MPDFPGTIRAFVAIQLPADVRSGLDKLQRELKSGSRTNAIRWVPPDHIHLTLRFFGSIASGTLKELETALMHACDSVRRFELRAGGLGAFPNLSRPRVLWIGLAGDLEILHRLQQAIARASDAWGEQEAREFQPHLTLARIREPRAPGVRETMTKTKSMEEMPLASWEVKEVHLMRSELLPDGARHSVVTTLPVRWVSRS